MLIGLLCISAGLFAQKKGGGYAPAEYKSTTCPSSFVKIKLEGKPGVDAVVAMLKGNSGNLKDDRTDLKLNYVNESPCGYHYSFTQLFNGIPVYQSEIKVNTDKNNVVHSMFDNSYNTSGWQVSTAKADVNSVIAINPKTNEVVVAQKTMVKGHLETLTVDGEVIFQTDIASYDHPAADSTVSGLVFNPDPLTTSQHIWDTATGYFSPQVNFDGPWLDDSWLDAQQQSHTFKAYFDGDSFRLQSQFVQLTNYDTGAPDMRPVVSANGQFNFNRTQSGFQDVNAFYHISTYHDYVHSLGFNCADSFVYADTHSMWDDNSFFTWGVYPSQIWYGVGGVPDAEDADVVVHEYCHSLSYTAAPQSNQGYERRSIDEGFCDYNAASYSKNLSTFYDFWVYNWDGHNDYWPGRVVNSTGVYPQDMDGDIYDNGQMWSSALFSLQADLGRGVVDSLILQTNYSYAINISMADCAQLLIDADTMLYGGSHYCEIFNRLLEHGFVTLAQQNNCTAFSANSDIAPSMNMRFMQHGNWFTFATDGSEQYTMQILSITGQQAAPAIISQDAVYNYQNSNLSAGIYLVNIISGNTRQTYKWVNTGL